MTADGVREIRLPLLPARMLSLEGYVEALTRHGFRIVSIERTTDYHSQSKEQATAVNTEHEVVIIAAKPVLPGK